MPDLLLELFSEEIPARMQRRAAADLQKMVTDALVEAGFVYEGAKAFATPRRLALTVHGIPAKSLDTKEERKGPRVGAGEKAIGGFLKAAGLASIDQAKVQKDPKGDFYVAVAERKGKSAEEVIAEIVPKVIRAFPWPKSMRWGASSAKPGSLAWVRPLHSMVCLYGPETAATEIVHFEVGGLRSSDITYGHRFMAPGPITVRRFDDYLSKLERAKVVLDTDRRKAMILADARDRALAAGLELVEDDGLAEEVAGLVEWPVVLSGTFDPAFLEIPPEVIRTTIRANQKCFVLRKADGQLANRFILVANIEASDGGKAIVAGNERVIRARLSDARYFWETDLKTKLADRLPKLDRVVFHEKLGTQGERVQRIMRLAREIAPLVGADPDKAERAAKLAKADLVTEMVGEFPELQGLMGKYYALAEGEDASVATAIEDHYKPVGPADRVPTDPVAVAVALADKLDTLVGFWAIDEKPTGSKDPYALRRAALGVIRIVLENNARVGLTRLFRRAALPIIGGQYYAAKGAALDEIRDLRSKGVQADFAKEFEDKFVGSVKAIDFNEDQLPGYEAIYRGVETDLLAFFADRLKIQLRDQGARHDLVDAVFALGQPAALSEASSTPTRSAAPTDLPLSGGGEQRPSGIQDDLLLIVRRVEALGKFLDSEDGKALLAGYRRATNILRDEEKKHGEKYEGYFNYETDEPAERDLMTAVSSALMDARIAVVREDFAAAMTALAKLRAPVDAFFEKVRVNADDPAVRENRLRLLNRIREATLAVADFSKIAG